MGPCLFAAVDARARSFLYIAKVFARKPRTQRNRADLSGLRRAEALERLQCVDTLEFSIAPFVLPQRLRHRPPTPSSRSTTPGSRCAVDQDNDGLIAFLRSLNHPRAPRATLREPGPRVSAFIRISFRWRGMSGWRSDLVRAAVPASRSQATSVARAKRQPNRPFGQDGSAR